MNFVEAIQSGFGNYTNFQGRTQRSGYWYWFLFMLLANIAMALIDGAIFGFQEDGTGGPLSLVFALATLLPSIAVAIRRLHDTDRTGWWLLLALIPILGLLVLVYFYVQKGTEGANRFGLDPLGHA